MTLSTNNKTLLLILLAFIFSFSVRLLWVQQFNNTEQFKFNGEFMINTNDGYYYAEGARDILSGTSQENDYSPITSAGSQFTAFIAKILPLSFETIIFYMPAFFSSLLVIPIILIGREFGKLEVGFIAALLASIAWSYYNRTMVGYYDTDFLNIVFPTVLLWSLIWAVETKEDKYLLFAAADILAYRWWYPQSYALEFAFFGLITVYLFYLLYKNKHELSKFYENKNIIYIIQLLTIMLLAMVQMDIVFRMILVFGYFILLQQQKWTKNLYLILIASIILFMITGGLDPIIGKLKAYVFTDVISTGKEGLQLQFFTVMQTIREAGKIPFETFANRISGHTITFVLSIIGYMWLTYKYRVMLLALPMIGLGFLALSGGLRFTIYAIPALSLGIAYFIYKISKFLSKQLINDMAKKITYYSLLILFTIAILYPNIKHAQSYKVPTVFTKNEVKVLDRLKKIANREDYVVAWWDYGYPLRYYSDIKTLTDGSKHSGSVNFPVSFILNSPQNIAAKMARLDVEYTENCFTKKCQNTNIEQMTIDYGYKNTNDFINKLRTNIQLPKKSRDIFIYLPNRMMNIFPTVTLFSNIDLMNGKKGSQPFFYQSTNFKENGTKINLGNGISIDKKRGKVQIGKQNININNFAVTQYDNKGILKKKIQTIDKKSPINVIFMKNYNKFLVLDSKTYNSLYIQLFVLENYDKNLFEPVIFDPLSKIYKLKI